MTTFRPDTSFPFLKIARERDCDYRQVLVVAEMIERGDLWWLATPTVAAIAAAVGAEAQRRATIIHNARHTGDAP